MGFDYNAEIEKAITIEKIASNLKDSIKGVSSAKTETVNAWSKNRVAELDALYDETTNGISSVYSELMGIASDIRAKALEIRQQEEEAARIAAEQEYARQQAQAAALAAAAAVAASASNTYIPSPSPNITASTTNASQAILKKIKALEEDKAKLEKDIKQWSKWSFIYSHKINDAKKRIKEIDKELERLR